MPKSRAIPVTTYISHEDIERKIYSIRGKRVMLDQDLSGLYGVETGALNRAVRRNIYRFPEDFMFQLTPEEFENLRCQFGISSWGGRRYTPQAFTEQGIAMLSSVLNSKKAVRVNIQIMRTFTHMREWALTRKDLYQKIEDLESKYKEHDMRLDSVFEAIRRMLEPPVNPNKRPIGFNA